MSDARDELVMHLVGKVDMSGWTPPTYTTIGTLGLARISCCGICGVVVADQLSPVEGNSAVPPTITGSDAHTANHYNLAEMMARFANAFMKLGVLPFVTIENVAPDPAG